MLNDPCLRADSSFPKDTQSYCSSGRSGLIGFLHCYTARSGHLFSEAFTPNMHCHASTIWWTCTVTTPNSLSSWQAPHTKWSKWSARTLSSSHTHSHKDFPTLFLFFISDSATNRYPWAVGRILRHSEYSRHPITQIYAQNPAKRLWRSWKKRPPTTLQHLQILNYCQRGRRMESCESMQIEHDIQ